MPRPALMSEEDLPFLAGRAPNDLPPGAAGVSSLVRTALFVLMARVLPRRQRLAGLGLDGGFVDRGGALHVGAEIGSRRHQVVFHLLAVGGAGGNADAGRIDALLLHQVVLGVDRALGCEVVHLGLLAAGGDLLLLLSGRLFLGVGVANLHGFGVGLVLQVESLLVEAPLGLVVL